MSKHNIFAKKLKKQFLSINDLIESYFNRLRLFVLKFKKSKFSTNNKVILISGILVISIICYFLIPSFYNKNQIQEEIKNQISKKYDIDFSQMSLKFCEMQPFMTSVIFGATSMEQLKSNIESVNVKLSNEIIKEINQIQKIYPNPCP